MEKTKLFCIPYAGGSAAVYRDWHKKIHSSIEVIPVELAGRGLRIKEGLYRDFEEATEDICEFIRKNSRGSSYSIFGHSMGGWLAMEVADVFAERGESLPDNLFISAACPPHKTPHNEKVHLMEDEEFRRYIAHGGGTSKLITEDRDAFSFFAPIIRADYKILENFVPTKTIRKLNCRMTVFRGTDDIYSSEDMELWEHYVKEECNHISIKGKHFFILDKQEEVVNKINVIVRKKETN